MTAEPSSGNGGRGRVPLAFARLLAAAGFLLACAACVIYLFGCGLAGEGEGVDPDGGLLAAWLAGAFVCVAATLVLGRWPPMRARR